MGRQIPYYNLDMIISPVQEGMRNMLEVCFNDSVKASLAFAQQCGNDRIGDAVPLGGNREDLVGISFGLSEGDIRSPIRSENCPRKDYIRSMFSFDRYNQNEDNEDNEDMEASINKFWTNCINDLEKLKSYPPQIRVWLDGTPDAQCGLLFIADLLKDSKTKIHIVELPKKTTGENNCIVEYCSWGEVEPQLYATFLDHEKILTEKEVADLANKWELLKAENASLRVVENDTVISADISYYDDLIKKEFPKDNCKIAFVIGSALGKHNILTGDVFIARRIQHFIDSGQLVVLGEPELGFYSTSVKYGKVI